jgi:hypothetical protein
MGLLVVAFQEGFSNDLVIVRINGLEVFRKEDVETKLLLGYADSFRAEVPEGSANVEVILPLRKLSETLVVQVVATVYLGVSIQEGRIAHLVSHKPFGYL